MNVSFIHQLNLVSCIENGLNVYRKGHYELILIVKYAIARSPLGLSVTVYEAAKQHCLDTEETSAFSGSLNDKNIPCQREWVIRIPDRYVSNGAVARKIMDLGEMNLEVELEDEDQECIHH
ncbi:Transthyretin-like family protein [Onchocerca flexuosa]|uniref:Transthyretin-like family protein n=1 Tax=Onchocerca flexuosa TaxID=387005 RepID=A0A238BX90_9BILA|nr:Transthyretin-like family protein [Onchocerca flexuosa]